MPLRSPELHISALSPPEYRAFTHYLDLLHDEQSNSGNSPHPARHRPGDRSGKIDKVILRKFVVERLKVTGKNVDEIFSRMPSVASSQLSTEETFAVLRLLAHAQFAAKSALLAKRPVDFELVFVPIEPLLIDPSPVQRTPREPPPRPPKHVRTGSASASTTSAPSATSRGPPLPARHSPPLSPPSPNVWPPKNISRSRNSLPATYPSNPFHDTEMIEDAVLGLRPSAKNRALSVSSAVETPSPPALPPKPVSTNPFRQRVASQPHSAPSSTIASAKTSKPPPLPPRKLSVKATSGPSLPPRKASVVTSSSSSIQSAASSAALFPPTSMSTPSSLMQQSLLAAENARGLKKKDSATFQVIRRSSDASLGTDNLKRGTSRLNSKESSILETEKDKTHHRAASADSMELSSKQSELRARVAEALREAEEPPRAPPRRTPSKKVVPKSSSLADRKLPPEDSAAKYWDATDILSGSPSDRSYAMVILNQPITRKDTFLRAWEASEVRLCADGGANRLYDLWTSDTRASYLPTLIKGDLDSIRPDVRQYYASKGVSVQQDQDEYSTDLMKCIAEIEIAERSKGKETRQYSFVLSEESLAWVLDEGSHIVEIDHETMGQTCGILPVGIDESFVKTEGLKWNLDWKTSFDGEISTSNHLLPSEPLVRITTSKPVMWCIEVKRKLGLPRVRHRESSTHTTATDDLTKGIRELGMGVARAAGEVGKELEWLTGGRGNRRPSMRDGGEERSKLVERESDEEIELEHDVTGNGGWKMLE
ncbi:thiamine pyrophosphokinase, partial [Tremellales sp. Uapishka_1]